MGPHWKGTLSLQTSPGQTWFCTVLASPEEGQPSAEPALCPSVSRSPSDVCSVSRRTPHCLSTLRKRPQHPGGVHHPLKGSSGGFRASPVPGFSPCLALVRKFSVFHTCMAGAAEGGRIVRRNGWPTLSSSEGWEAKYDGRDRVLQLRLCQGDFSPPLALSSAEAELKLEAGTGFLRKEEKLGNVY